MTRVVASRPQVNFGRNIDFTARHFYEPASEAEVLDILTRHRGEKIRVVGRLHSWSPAPAGDDVVLDLRRLNFVRVETRDGKTWATVGAGCQIKRLLKELDRQAGSTMPALGLIDQQAIAGASSTGTHGSGRHSLSHYLEEVRVACYDPSSGEAIVRTLAEGEMLQAARCSLGCLGVILTVGFWCRPQYRVEEYFQRHETLESVLACEADEPLQQFYLTPWVWSYWGQHRHETSSPRSRLARLYRLYCFLHLDVTFHLLLLLLTRVLRSPGMIRFFYRRLLPKTILCGWRVRDISQKMLLMQHHLFRHIEMELFVTRSQLPKAMDFVKRVIRHCAGECHALSAEVKESIDSAGMSHLLAGLEGRYTHAYPICIRRVLIDDTLISMASGGEEPHYAISLISYEHPDRRAAFFEFATLLFALLTRHCAARPHWGKWSPATSADIQRLYPRLDAFRRVCHEVDPHGVFRNAWTDQLLFDRRPD